MPDLFANISPSPAVLQEASVCRWSAVGAAAREPGPAPRTASGGEVPAGALEAAPDIPCPLLHLHSTTIAVFCASLNGG